MMELQSHGETNGKQFWTDRQAMYHSLAPLALDLLSAPAPEAYAEHIFSLCGMLRAGSPEDELGEYGDACLPEAEQ